MTRGEAGTVAVTGATGFLGRAIVTALLAAGDSVVALARPSTDRSRLPEHERLAWVGYDDLADPVVADELSCHAPTSLLHAGWAGVAGTARGQVDHVAVNVPATIASVRLASASGCSYWIGVGSQAEYGPTDDVTTETSQLRPTTEYGIAKVAAAGAAHATGAALDVSTGWARVYSIYGPGDHPGAVLSYAIAEMLDRRSPQLGACSHDWDLLFVDDAAAAFVALLRHEIPGPINVAHGEQRSLRAAIDLAHAAIADAPAPTYGDAISQALCGSSARIRGMTGWRPRTSLKQGVAAAVRAATRGSATIDQSPATDR